MSADAQADFQEQISNYIKQDFTLKSCSYDAGLNDYIITGTICRCQEQVNVQAFISGDTMAPTYWSIIDNGFKMDWRSLPDITLSKDVVFSDPCYSRDDGWVITVLHNMLPGAWKTRACIDTISAWGKRCHGLELVHSLFADEESLPWKQKALLPVDSGLMSVVDDMHYRRENGSIQEFESSEEAKGKFADKCYALALKLADIFRVNGEGAGIVAMSGFGDGAYPLHVVERDGEVIAAKITLLH